MKYAVIDTETTGLHDFSKPADAEGQPRLASLVIITLDDRLWREDEWNWFVKPNGWAMPAEATSVNGLTNEFLMEVGRPVKDLLDVYAGIVDSGYVVAGHNVSYDLKVMRGELRRAGFSDRYEQTESFCTMRSTTDICKIPGGRRGWKWPKLSEACHHFSIEHVDQHTSLGDVQATIDLMRKLRAMGVI